MIESGAGWREELSEKWKTQVFNGKQRTFCHSQECWSKHGKSRSA
jgi:hypothetical protein